MIVATFAKTKKQYAVEVSGHAGYAGSGEDIVCAAVTSAVQLTANALTEILKTNTQVHVGEDLIAIVLPAGAQEGVAFIEALQLHLNLLLEEYPGTITVNTTEV